MSAKLKIPKQLFREGTASLDNGSIRLSICSDEPYLRYNWADDTEYYEVLDHSEGGVDLSRIESGAALLFNHKRDIQLGMISNPSLENGKCYVKAKLSNAPDVASYKARIEEGILKDTSIGYDITDDGTEIGRKDGVPIYKFKFAIHEASLVTIPADPTVGLGRCRSEEPKCGFKEISIGINKNVDLTPETCNKQEMTKENEPVAVTPETPVPAAEPEVKQAPVAEPAVEEVAVVAAVDLEAVKADAVKLERARISELRTWAGDISKLRNIDLTEPLYKHIEDGKSLPEFKEWVLENEFKAKPLEVPSEAAKGNTMKRSAFNALSIREQAEFLRTRRKAHRLTSTISTTTTLNSQLTTN